MLAAFRMFSERFTKGHLRMPDGSAVFQNGEAQQDFILAPALLERKNPVQLHAMESRASSYPAWRTCSLLF